MTDFAIRIENLSKQFRIGLRDETHETFIGKISSLIKKPIQNFRKISYLKNFYEESNQADIFWALKDISMEFQYGKVTGLIGPNGAGKTTLLKIISKILAPSSGKVMINGRVGSLLEVGTGFHPDLTGRENIYLNGTILGMNKSEIDKNFDEIVDFSGIENFIDTPIKRFSTGMTVRLAFSVAAFLEPEILLIDEVLAVGDAEFQKKCLDKMNSIASEGRTVLFVTHDMGAIESLCEDCFLIENGQLRSQGKSSNIIDEYLNRLKIISNEKEINYRSDRTGAQLAKISKLYIADEKGRRTNNLISGQLFSFKIEVINKSLEKLENFNINLAIYNNQGRFITELNNRLVKNNFTVVDNSVAKLSCIINKNPFMRGEFFVEIALFVNDIFCDRVQNALCFNVLEGDYFGSGNMRGNKRQGIFIDQEWKIS